MVKSLMEQKFIRDYFMAEEIDNAVVIRQYPLSEGVKSLKNMIKKIENDIRLLDGGSYEQIISKVKEFNDKCKKRKAELQEIYSKRVHTDSYTDEQHRNDLENENHETCQEILVAIADLGYQKGWLE